jgi:hypothetical protein
VETAEVKSLRQRLGELRQVLFIFEQQQKRAEAVLADPACELEYPPIPDEAMLGGLLRKLDGYSCVSSETRE